MPPEILAILALVGFVAGFFDAIAGGGGLLGVPATVPAYPLHDWLINFAKPLLGG